MLEEYLNNWQFALNFDFKQIRDGQAYDGNYFFRYLL